jgi:hypothetical protein
MPDRSTRIVQLSGYGKESVSLFDENTFKRRPSGVFIADQRRLGQRYLQ